MKNKIRILIGSFIFCGILSWGFNVSADTIFTDDFNSYTTGTLHRQGGWIGSNYIVTTSTVKEGEKGVVASSIIGGSVGAIKSGTLLNDGQITVYVRRFDTNQPGIFSFKLREGGAAKIEVRGNYGANAKFQYINGGTGSYVNFGVPFLYETWYALQIQWRSSDHSARYNIDGGTWSDWAHGIAPWTAGLDTVALETIHAMAWDTIQENPIGAKTPVLIVPGLIGTELGEGSETFWADFDRMAISPDDSFLDKLSFEPNLEPTNSNLNTKGVIGFETLAGARVFDYTDTLITDLQNQGYAIDENLFLFPYDWRYGVTGIYADGKTNTDLLQEKIADILEQTDADKVDVIAHSMGGLIVKQYAKNHPMDSHIQKAVFVGVPNTGSPKSVKTLLEGDNLGMFFVSQEEIKKISENMPAIYDLLPSQKYYDVKGSYVKVIDQGLTGLFTTTKDLTYSETKSFLSDDSQLNDTAVANADSLHSQSFDDFDMRTTGIDLYAIDGCKAGTLGKITQVWSKDIFGNKLIDYKKPKMVPGDGTVPLESATNLPIDQAKKFYSLTGEHGKMLSQDGIRQQIVNLVSGSTLEVKPEIITQNIDECNLNGKAIAVFSPVDIFVTDQDGKVMGLASDGSVFNEIPNADFQIWGTHKFLYLPTDNGQTYTISMDGTGAGTYTIKSDDIENNEVVKTQVFSNLPVTETLTGTVNLGETTTLTVLETLDSVPQTILPSAVITGDDVEDVLPPEATVVLTGTQGQAGFYLSDVTVTVTATDDNSGVLSVSPPATFTTDGSHTFTFFATDNAGNNSQPQTITFAIDKTAPEIMITTPVDGATYTLKQTLLADWTVGDSLSGIASATATTPAGDPIDTLSPGIKSFTVTATDVAGNVTVKTFSYSVVYVFTDFSAPTTITKTDFKKMSTIPIKFRLKDVNGNYINNAAATLKVNGVNAVSSGGANTGNLFKYDLTNQQYVFNLSAKLLSPGVNTLLVSLDDGTFQSRVITIK